MAGLLGTVLSGLRAMMLDTRSHVRNIELARGIPPLDCEILSVNGEPAAGREAPEAPVNARGAWERDLQ